MIARWIDEPIAYDGTQLRAHWILTRFGIAGDAIVAFRDALGTGDGFDIVILDLVVPGGVGGLETLHGLREISPAVRAIVSSGYSNDPIMAQHDEHGFCDVVAKPYNMVDLARTVHRWLPTRIVTGTG